MRTWLRKWTQPIGWKPDIPNDSDHPLGMFLHRWLLLLAVTALAGMPAGLALEGFEVSLPEGAASSSRQAVLTVALALFIATQLREPNLRDSFGSRDISDLAIRAILWTVLFAGAALAAFFAAVEGVSGVLLSYPSWLLYAALLAALRPDNGPLPRELAQREFIALSKVRGQLAQALGAPAEGIPTAPYLRTALLLSVPAPVVVAAAFALVSHNDAEAWVNGPVAILCAGILSMCWFFLGDALVQLRAFSQAQAYGSLAGPLMNCVLSGLVLAVFGVFGLLVVGIHFFTAETVLPSQWLLALPSLILGGLGLTTAWQGRPSPRLVSMSALADIDARIRVLSERVGVTSDYSI